jgi:ribosomal protein S18 acetylase RimI-like enzyme
MPKVFIVDPLEYLDLTLHSFDAIEDDELFETVQRVAAEYAAAYSAAAPYVPTRANFIVCARDGAGKTIGFAAWQEWEGKAFIGLAWVAPGRRREGIYTQLFLLVQIGAAHRGLKAVSCQVDVSNKASVAAHDALSQRRVIFYEKPLSDQPGVPS